MGTYYNEIRNRLILAAVNVNSFANKETKKDIARCINRYQCGRLAAFAEVLEDLGHTVSIIETWNASSDCPLISKLEIDDEIIIENTDYIV